MYLFLVQLGGGRANESGHRARPSRWPSWSAEVPMETGTSRVLALGAREAVAHAAGGVGVASVGV